MIPESSIEPVEIPRLADVEMSEEQAAEAIGVTAVIKLNGGLGTSMGMDRAKSLLCVRRGLSFLDVIARQVPAPAGRVRRTPAADLHELLPHLGRHPGGAGPLRGPRRRRAAPWSSCRTRSPRSAPHNLQPVTWSIDPELEWCPPGHGDLYTAMRGTGLLDKLIDARLPLRVRLQLRQPRRRARRPGWPAGSPAPGRRSRWRRCAATPTTRRAGTSPPGSTTGGSCCARPPRPCPRTGRPWPTSSGTATPPRTTSGSTSRRCAPSWSVATGSSGCR